MTRKNKWVAGILYTVVIAQLGIGINNFIYAIGNSGNCPSPKQGSSP